MKTLSGMPLRLARASDRGALGAFLARLSPATARARYLAPIPLTGLRLEREVDRLQQTDAARHTVVVAVDGDAIRGIGEFSVSESEQDCADVAIVVEDAFQGRGIGTSLFDALERTAFMRGVRAFTGDIGSDNHRMLALLRGAGRPLHIKFGYGSAGFELTLRAPV